VNPGKVTADFIVILIQGKQCPSLDKNVIQNRTGEIIFVFAMMAQQGFHQRSESFDFLRGRGSGQDSFNFVEHLAENRMFKDKGFGDCCHVCYGLIERQSHRKRAGCFPSLPSPPTLIIKQILSWIFMGFRRTHGLQRRKPIHPEQRGKGSG
jgi:hypothetical protein